MMAIRKFIKIGLLLLIVVTGCKEPKEYYSKAVYAGNMAISLSDMESRIANIQDGNEPESIGLVSRVQNRILINETYLEELRGFMGSSESDPMVKSAIAYLEHDIYSAKDPKMITLLEQLDKKLQPEALEQLLSEYDDYLDAIYSTKETLWAAYDKEVVDYAKKHDIEEIFYGPDLQPIAR
ncbi:hypothetical protein [Maribacter sp. R77961]|uniref:hypothetical protein n=1 Tax=Maribacter sp. R77961 TaxID=3093871 RepID=UPI0037CC0786